MNRISIKIDIKILIILAFALILGFFVFHGSAKAQCVQPGYPCTPGASNPCCNPTQWQCLQSSFPDLRRCMRPLGASCTPGDENYCFPRPPGNIGLYFACSSSGQCCGRHFYPCSPAGRNDGTSCCDDPNGAGDFYCTSGGYCAAECNKYCTNWTNQGCAQGGCAANEIYQTRTCTNNTVVCATSQCITDCTCNTTASSACYNGDLYWYDACGNPTTVKEDCGTDTLTNNFRCSGSVRQQEFLSQGCTNNACYSTSTWNNVQDCGSNYCENWAVCGCDGNYIKECRTCHNKGCNNGACYDNPYTEERRSTNCDVSDGCAAGTYRDFSCSNGACVSTDLTCDARCNNPPNIPGLINPLNNAWINFDPTFTVRVLDNDGGNVRAHFNILNFGTGTGNWVNSGQTNQWGPVNLGTACAKTWWQARAEDSCGFFSNWSGWWLVNVDKTVPTNSISYPTGTINYLTFSVNLTESDDCSSIAEGDVDVSLDNGTTWTNQGLPYSGTTIDNFIYTGSAGQCYKFRYQVRDAASNWSNFAAGEQVCIDMSIPKCSIDYPNGWLNTASFDVTLAESDPGGSIAQGNVDIQIKQANASYWPIWSDYSTTIDDFTYTNAQNCYFYKFRYQVQDNAGNWSIWSEPNNITKIDFVKPTANISYPTGIMNTTTFTVNLSDADDCSGVAQRNLELSTDNGPWQAYPASTTFVYIGSYGHRYQFRYQVRDDAGNWSDYVQGGIIELKALPSAVPNPSVWSFCPDIALTLNWNYSDINNLPQSSFQIQIDDNDDFSSPIFDSQQVPDSRNSYTLSPTNLNQLMTQTKYYWQIRVKNSAGDWSPWGMDSNLLIFFKKIRDYSTFY